MTETKLVDDAILLANKTLALIDHAIPMLDAEAPRKSISQELIQYAYAARLAMQRLETVDKAFCELAKKCSKTGVDFAPGDVAVVVKGQFKRCPSWKTLAVSMAERWLGMNEPTYVKSIMEQTEEKECVTVKLVVNGSDSI